MNTKKQGIQSKITRLVILAALISLLVVALVTIGSMLIIRNVSLGSNDHLGATAAEDAKSALQNQMMDRLSETAQSRVAIGDEKLKFIQSAVQMIAATASEIIDSPERYKPMEPTPPDPALNGQDTFQCLFPETLDLEPVRAQAELMANIQTILMRCAKANPAATTTYIGTEEGFFYAVDNSSGVKAAHAEPRERPWYVAAKAAGEMVWTDVVDDQFGRGIGMICAVPFFDAAGNFRGVAGIGTLLTPLGDMIAGTKIGKSGYAYILNETGQLIISRDIQKGEDGKLIRPNLLQSDNQELREATERMIKSDSGVEDITLDGRQVLMAYESMTVKPWTVVTVVDRDEALMPASQSESRIIAMADDSAATINQAIWITIAIIAGVILLTILLTIWISMKFSKRLTQPIEALNDGVETIAGGNLDYRIQLNTGDEIEVLGGSVNKMAQDLKNYIENLQRVTGEKERIGAELNVATKIQASMLPCIFPAFPERSEFDIYATMLPAKEVGGDFYDFFLITEDKLAVVMADVSGKGVPAALFMVIAKTLIKNNAQYGKSPGEVFETVNNLLCENNEAGMFVTAFMGYLTISTGEFTYVNAGHNPPLIKRAGGDYEWMPTKAGFVLAGMDGVRYREFQTQLGPDDIIYLYTDGVTEAVNREEALFSDPRLLSTVNHFKDKDIYNLLSAVKQEIDQFADGAEQADDITMLALKINGDAQ